MGLKNFFSQFNKNLWGIVGECGENYIPLHTKNY
jgi:hypothetical protein